MRGKVVSREEVVDVLDVNYADVARGANVLFMRIETTFPYVSRNVWTTQIQAGTLDSVVVLAVLFAYVTKIEEPLSNGLVRFVSSRHHSRLLCVCVCIAYSEQVAAHLTDRSTYLR